jgi:predicted Zn-dependent protease
VLNRDIPVFPQRYRRAIVHEFGHVVGVGHSQNPEDIMYSGGRHPVPTERDLEACNKEIEVRYGVKQLRD